MSISRRVDEHTDTGCCSAGSLSDALPSADADHHPFSLQVSLQFSFCLLPSLSQCYIFRVLIVALVLLLPNFYVSQNEPGYAVTVNNPKSH